MTPPEPNPPPRAGGELPTDGPPEDMDAEGQNPATESPLSNLPFTLTVPEIEVKMVNAGSLSHYEIWIAATTLSLSTAVGFLVAYLQSFHENAAGVMESDIYLLVVAIIFGMLTLLFFVALLLQRRALWKESTRYRMRGTRVVDHEGGSDS